MVTQTMLMLYLGLLCLASMYGAIFLFYKNKQKRKKIDLLQAQGSQDKLLLQQADQTGKELMESCIEREKYLLSEIMCIKQINLHYKQQHEILYKDAQQLTEICVQLLAENNKLQLINSKNLSREKLWIDEIAKLRNFLDKLKSNKAVASQPDNSDGHWELERFLKGLNISFKREDGETL